MSRLRPLALALLVLASVVRPAAAQDTSASCVRVAFGAWTPPLSWGEAGHLDSVTRIAARTRLLRDSVFNGEATVGGRDDMVWFESAGTRRLLLFPAWWPAGVMVTFDSPARDTVGAPAASDTLTGKAVALVADGTREASGATARLIRRGCRT
jgi:hypothetical protein